MATGLVILTPTMEVHAFGCADITRSIRHGRTKSGGQVEGTLVATKGADLIANIIRADTKMAGWFCQDVYANDGDQPWTVTACKWAPCISPDLEKMEFEKTGQPKGWVK